MNVGQAGADDSDIMTYARDNNYLILTRDLDFGTLLAQKMANGASVILIREGGVVPQTVGADILSLLKQYETELLMGSLIVSDSSRHRVRILPIGEAKNGYQKDASSST
ncbi:MAG: DUF5615 family PIN-like protein [Trueperaceae bacterium]